MTFWQFLFIVEWAIRIAMVPVILRRRFTPGIALAWLGVVMALPEVGLLIYMLVGDRRLGRRRVKLHRQVVQAMRTPGRLASQRAHITRPKIGPAQLPMILQAERLSGMPIIGGNTVEMIGSTGAMIDRLIADIDAAQHHVHLLFYIYQPDKTGMRVGEALVRAVKRGIKCRLLADAAGSWTFFAANGMADELRDNGVEVHATLPAAILRRKLARLDLRNHRKLAVIDGRIAYAGSQNIVEPDYGHDRIGAWIDLTGRFTGPVVAQMQVVFLEDWAFETDEIIEGEAYLPPLEATGDTPIQAVPTGPSHDDSETLPRILLSAINTAQHNIIITSPYIVPDEPTLLALAMAVDRGVDVELVVPEVSDHRVVSAAGRAYFPRLLEAGVRIHTHKGGLLHSKTMTIDNSFALLGTANLDIRSLYLNFELNVLLYGAEITEAMKKIQRGYIEQSTPVSLSAWRARPWYLQYAESAAALLSPLL